MNLFKNRTIQKTRGQTMVEFALILPVLLLTMYGVMEFGRLLFIYVTTASATREAARYAAAVGISDNGVPFYNDCAGIIAEAQRVGILAGIQNSDVIIRYDSGPGGSWSHNGCPAPSGHPSLGERVVVTVTGHFEPVVPIVPIGSRDIQSVTARTIIRDVRVTENFIAPQIVVTQPPSPYVTFTSSQTDVSEGVGSVTVTVQTDIPVPVGNGPLTVEVGVIDVLEALGGGIDYQINSSLTMVFQEGEQFKPIDISIIDDLLYENIERIILYIRSVSNNNLGYPRLHVIRIDASDSDQVPIAYFPPGTVVTINENDTSNLVIPVVLDRPSGVGASVDFNIGTLTYGPSFGYTPLTARLSFPVNYSSTYRTVTSSSAVIITPINDSVSTGDRTILITLTNPVNATLDTVDPITHPYTIQVTIVDDDLCSLTPSSIQRSGTDFWVDITNLGGGAVLSGMDVGFTGGNLTSVTVNGVQVWSGTAASPAVLSGLNQSIPTGSNEILLRFSDPTTMINSWSLDFGYCGSLTVGPTPYPPPP